MELAMEKIELVQLTNDGEVHSLSGQERGVAARQHFDLDYWDNVPESVTVAVPEDLDAISPSFFQGMFAKSLTEKFGRDANRFQEHYLFDAPTHILVQVQRGIAAILTRRPGQPRHA